MAHKATLEDLVGLIAQGPPGRRVQVPSGLVVSTPLYEALKADPQACEGAVFTGLFIPGVNEKDYSALHPGARMQTPLLSAGLRSGFEAGRIDPFPNSYRRLFEALEAPAASAVGVAVVAPLGKGRYSFGVAADAGPAAVAAKIPVALVNEALPAPTAADHSVIVEEDAFHALIAVSEPIGWLPPDAPLKGPLAAVAANAAGLIEDGDCLQFGIGKLPGQILASLKDRRALRVHSGLYHDALADLLDAGALDASALSAGVVLGGQSLAQRLIAAGAKFRAVRDTHDPSAIARLPRFTALNSALQVDLFGQINAEFIGDRLVSGPGGLPDFAQGAQLSPGGRLIIALPATAGAESRIVPRLTSPWATLPRGFAHLIVTEHGVADLRGLSLDSAAQALIAIADPAHQDSLAEAWATLRRAL